MGNKCKHYKNGTGPVLLNSRICCSSMGEIYIRRHTGPELNTAYRAITGCIKPSYVEDLYFWAGIAPLDIRRDVCARMKQTRQIEQETHSLFGHIPARSRLKSRKDFLTSLVWYHPTSLQKSYDETSGRGGQGTGPDCAWSSWMKNQPRGTISPGSHGDA